MESTNPQPARPSRLVSLDAYRGLIMLTLLCGGIFHSLKNDPQWNWLYKQNDHVAWEGAVYWDFIQPSFMFMVGVAMPFAFARRTEQGQCWLRQMFHALSRAINLCIVGIFLDHVGASKIQIGFIRVLQQIAPGYFLCFFLLGRKWWIQWTAAIVTLIAYQILWMYNSYNGPGGPWAMTNQNIGSAFDFWMLHRNYDGYYVGLNCIPSAVTILLGVMAGQVIHRAATPARAAGTLLIFGLLGTGIGLLIGLKFPIIKRIWTPSFTIYAAGVTTLALLLFYAIIDWARIKFWTYPLVVVGVNSIAAYCIAGMFGSWFRNVTNVWINWLKPHMGEPWFLVFQRGLFAIFAWSVLLALYKRRIYIKL